MTKYYCIKKAFAYLESEYGFRRYMKQVHGAYYYIAWTNGKRILWCCMMIKLMKK